MGKAALLCITAFIISSSYYNLASHDGEAGALRATSEHQLGVLARNGAVAGYGQAKQAIADAGAFSAFTTTPASLEGTYEGATYETSITSDGSAATIISTGTAGNSADEVSTTITAVIGMEDAAATDVPPFLSYALITERDLILNGNIGAYVVDQESELNANFHTNGDLHVNGNAANVAGFGSFAGAGTANPNRALAGTFQPNYNPGDVPTAYRSSAVDIPPFDSGSFLENVAVDATAPGDVQLAGSIDLGGTREDPYIWHVQGDLTASGGASVEGYVMFVVDGDINLSGTLSAGAAGEESSIALYAGDDVTISGNVQIHGQVYAGGDVIFNGTPDIHGSVATHASAILNGTPGIHYRPASPALTTIFADEATMKLLSYYER